MLRATLMSLVLALGLAASAACADEGKGPGDTSKSTLSQLSMGEYWYGAKISKADLKGKVVLLEIWGS